MEIFLTSLYTVHASTAVCPLA